MHPPDLSVVIIQIPYLMVVILCRNVLGPEDIWLGGCDYGGFLSPLVLKSYRGGLMRS